MIINPYLVQPSGPSYDADAQAFFTAAGITDNTQKSAVNQLVLDLKSYSIWTKMTALYPFVGGTSTTHSYNLKNTAQYQITWYGGVTHNSNGVSGGGVNGYGDTGLTYTTLNSGHQCLYSRTHVVEGSYDMGAYNGGNTWQVSALYSAANLYIGAINADTALPRAAMSDTKGMYVNNRTGASACNLWRNGSKLTQSTQAVDSIPNRAIFIFTANLSGSPFYIYSSKNYAFASIGDGLDDTEAANFYTAVQAFQTTLSRNV